MRREIDYFFKSNSYRDDSEEDLRAHELLADFVRNFMNSDEFYLLESLKDFHFKAKMGELNGNASKDSSADLHRLAGYQGLIQDLIGIMTSFETRIIEKKLQAEENKSKEEFLNDEIEDGVELSDMSSLT